MQTKIRTEGLPEIFLKESVEKYELRISKEGTELAIGVDKEAYKIFIFCRGIHEKKYKMNYRKPDGVVERVEAQPFEGVVELTPSAFLALYFVVLGIEEETDDLGNNNAVKIRAKLLRENGKVQLVFSNYKKKQRTIVGLSSAKQIILQAIFERIKSILPVLTTIHQEQESLTIEFDRVMNTLHLIGRGGNVKVSPRTLPILKTVLYKTVINGVSLGRPFSIPNLVIYPDGAISLSNIIYGNKKVSHLLGGEEKLLPAISLKILQLIS